jgi:hypothetical protein
MNSTTLYPMPDTDCPRWCQEDHAPSWEQWVAVTLDPRPIPAAGGGYLQGPGTPLEEWLAQWTPYHRLPVGTAEIEDGVRVAADLVRDSSDGTYLYLEAGEGSMTAAQARQVAALLLDAADELDKVTR